MLPEKMPFTIMNTETSGNSHYTKLLCERILLQKPWLDGTNNVLCFLPERKSRSNYILGVSCIFQALSSSSTHTARTIRQSLSAWLENMMSKKLRVNDHLNDRGRPWRSNELLSDGFDGQLRETTVHGFAGTDPVSCLCYWQTCRKKKMRLLQLMRRWDRWLTLNNSISLSVCTKFNSILEKHTRTLTPLLFLMSRGSILLKLSTFCINHAHEAWIICSDSFGPIMLGVRVGVFSNSGVS